jgi:hypothetical protein
MWDIHTSGMVPEKQSSLHFLSFSFSLRPSRLQLCLLWAAHRRRQPSAVRVIGFPARDHLRAAHLFRRRHLL